MAQGVFEHNGTNYKFWHNGLGGETHNVYELVEREHDLDQWEFVRTVEIAHFYNEYFAAERIKSVIDDRYDCGLIDWPYEEEAA
jgi:hypothetical protein